MQLLQREQDVNRAEMERLRASETAKDTEIVGLRSELAASQQSAGSLRRQLDASTPFVRDPPNLFKTSSDASTYQPPELLSGQRRDPYYWAAGESREWVKF